MKSVKVTSTLGGDQLFSIFEPANLATGKHPVLLEMQGWDQIGNKTFDGNSVSGQLAVGKTLPAIYSDAIVINVHQQQNGKGIYEYQRFKDAYNYVVANYPTADLSRVAICGLSAGGGGVLSATSDIEFMKLICAIIPVAGTDDGIAGIRGSFFSNLKASKVPFRICGSSTDDNATTRSCFQVIQVLIGGANMDKTQGGLDDTKTGHTGTWAMEYDFAAGARTMWSWLAAQKLSTAPVVVVDPPKKKQVATVIIPGYTIPAVDPITIPGKAAVVVPDKKVIVYDDGTQDPPVNIN